MASRTLVNACAQAACSQNRPVFGLSSFSVWTWSGRLSAETPKSLHAQNTMSLSLRKFQVYNKPMPHVVSPEAHQ